MQVSELSPNQLAKLKQDYYYNILHADESVSWEELFDIDKLVTDEEVRD